MSAFGYRKPADLPQTIALFPLTGAILFPRGVLALNIFEPRYLNMIDDVLGAERMIGIIQPATGEEDEVAPISPMSARWGVSLRSRKPMTGVI